MLLLNGNHVLFLGQVHFLLLLLLLLNLFELLLVLLDLAVNLLEGHLVLLEVSDVEVGVVSFEGCSRCLVLELARELVDGTVDWAVLVESQASHEAPLFKLAVVCAKYLLSELSSLNLELLEVLSRILICLHMHLMLLLVLSIEVCPDITSSLLHALSNGASLDFLFALLSSVGISVQLCPHVCFFLSPLLCSLSVVSERLFNCLGGRFHELLLVNLYFLLQATFLLLVGFGLLFLRLFFSIGIVQLKHHGLWRPNLLLWWSLVIDLDQFQLLFVLWSLHASCRLGLNLHKLIVLKLLWLLFRQTCLGEHQRLL